MHEAFFDPVAIGTAVGADGANGVLNPSAFSLDGTTTTITSLKWEDGEVTMALSPTSTSLADYAIDFIDTTGTTTLSLTSDNASTTALTWTVPDAPWAAGDLLMLRIHEHVPPERAARSGQNGEYRFTMGMRLSRPKFRGVILTPGGAWRRLYSLRSTRLIVRLTTSASNPMPTISANVRSSST